MIPRPSLSGFGPSETFTETDGNDGAQLSDVNVDFTFAGAAVQAGTKIIITASRRIFRGIYMQRPESTGLFLSRSFLRVSVSRGTLLSGLALALGAPTAAFAQDALPTGGAVTSGAATITTAPTTVTVDQSSAKAIINWVGFSVGTGNAVVFNQPDASSATLNRVTGNETSYIAGQITSNGSVYLVNPNGIAITSTGTVRTGGGFVASTLGIADGDFNAGTLAFGGTGASRRVSNKGTITAATGGFVALLGGTVLNAGTITVPLGQVGLASGENVALDINGGGFLRVATPTTVITGGNTGIIEMTGQIAASGGRVELSAATVKDAVRNVVNMSGNISADSAIGDGGSIVLLGGDGGVVTASGTLSARATGAAGNGGFVETSGANVNFAGLTVDTLSASGAAGTWLVDPTNLTVDAAAATTIQNNLATANVTLQTTSTTATGPGNQSPGNGDITINSAISWNSTSTLSLQAYNNIALNAAIIGPSGGLSLTAGNGVPNTGAISASGAVNVGVFNLINGNWLQNGASLPTFAATDFRFNVTNASFLRATGGTGALAVPYAIADVYGLQGMASSILLANNFTLANNIDAGGTAAWNARTGFTPIGNAAGDAGFKGNFDGRGFAITGLTINRPSTADIGLFGYLTGALSNVGVIGGSVTGSSSVGGLVGEQQGGNLNNVFATGAVSGSNGVGGLVGNFRSGSISNAYAVGDVVGSNVDVGGLVGFQGGGSIVNVYATGSVSGRTGVGGLVGSQFGGYISSAYSSGAVSATNGNTGGLVGYQNAGSIGNAYWDTYSTGQSAARGFAGGTQALIGAVTSDPYYISQPNSAYKASAYGNLNASSGIGTAAPSGFAFLPGDLTRPFLAFEVPTQYTAATDASGALVLVTSHQLQLIGYDGVRLAGTYKLGADIDLSETGRSKVNEQNLPVNGPASLSGMWGGQGFNPIGTAGPAFGGSFNGAGHIINGLTISPRGTPSGVGLFSHSSGAISNVGLTGSNIITGSLNVGVLVGTQEGGSISYAYATGSVRGSSQVGGLVGSLQNGSINNSYVNVNVYGSNLNVGGLVGYQSGGSISEVYFIGKVDGGARVGGLVGLQFSGSISSAYASGDVYFGEGGLIGDQRSGGSITNSYWDSYSTSQSVGIRYSSGTITNTGAIVDSYKASSYTNLTAATGIGTATPTGIVFMPGNSTRPFLAFEVPTSFTAATDASGRLVIVNSHQLQLIGYDGTQLGGSYSLGNSIDLAETGRAVGTRNTNYTGMWAGSGWVPIGTDGGRLVYNGTSFVLSSDLSTGNYGFRGNFNGNGFAISNLTSNRAVGKNVGLFGVSSGALSNVTLGGTVTGVGNVGGLVGLQYGGSIFGVTSAVAANGGIWTGGLVGYASNSSIVTSSASGNVSTSYGFAGGLVGYSYYSNTSNSSASGNVVGDPNKAGGLMGTVQGGSINASTSTGTTNGSAGPGPLVGQNRNGATITP